MELKAPPPRSSEAFLSAGDGEELERLATLRAAADADPSALTQQWRAGTAHVRASLRGHIEQREHAERYLERAWRLDPAGERVPAARVLARFLNMRSSVMDLSKVELQLQLYASQQVADEGSGHAQLEPAAFHVDSFARGAEALRRYGEGDTLAALRTLERLERSLERRIAQYPEEIDTHTMAGNFALTFAGVLPVGVERRLQRGIEHLEVQQDHWEQLSPRARNTELAPNVRSVFAIFLAEALLAAGERESAAARYEQLIAFTPDEVPETQVRAQLVALARHRLANLDAYAGSRELLPPWPAGVSGCVACHARVAVLPTDDLYLLPELESSVGVELVP